MDDAVRQTRAAIIAHNRGGSYPGTRVPNNRNRFREAAAVAYR